MGRPLAPRSSSDRDHVMTPLGLACAIAEALHPWGHILEPCAGTGNFVPALEPWGERVSLCELDHGTDFLAWTTPVDWIVTNPPWSKFRPFLVHAMSVADDIALLATVNHWWTKARVRDVAEAGFGYVSLWLTKPWPDGFPASGFQLGVMHIRRGWHGPLHIQPLTWAQEEQVRNGH